MISHILRINPAMLAAVRGAPNNRENAEPAEKELSAGGGGDQRGKQNLPIPADVKRVWKNPWLIPDERLVREVLACVDADDAYSPLAERVRQCVPFTSSCGFAGFFFFLFEFFLRSSRA